MGENVAHSQLSPAAKARALRCLQQFDAASKPSDFDQMERSEPTGLLASIDRLGFLPSLLLPSSRWGGGNHDYQGSSNRTITGREVIPRPGPMAVHKECSHSKIPKTSFYSKTSSQPPEIASEDVLFKRTNNRTQDKTPQPTRIG